MDSSGFQTRLVAQAQLVWLGVKVGNTWRCWVCIYQMNHVNSRKGCAMHSDSTVKISTVIMIVITAIIILTDEIVVAL